MDDILAVHHDAVSAIKEIDRFFMMKPGSIGDPDIYLGAKLRQVQLPNGVYAWSLSTSKYVQEAVRNVKDYFKREKPGQLWPNQHTFPQGLPSGIRHHRWGCCEGCGLILKRNQTTDVF